MIVDGINHAKAWTWTNWHSYQTQRDLDIMDARNNTNLVTERGFLALHLTVTGARNTALIKKTNMELATPKES